LTTPVSGTVDIPTGTLYEDSATYTCDNGFKLSGVAVRKCQGDGSWSSVDPTCERKSMDWLDYVLLNARNNYILNMKYP